MTTGAGRGRVKSGLRTMSASFAQAHLGTTMMEIVVADITTLPVDAIVNAANRSLLGGGGVDGAIHNAAGPELRAACEKLGGCDTGSAKVTPGFRLPAKYVIHAVGPVWSGGGKGEDRALASCYRAALDLAREQKLESIAFSAISTGVYGYPADRAAHIAVGAVAAELVGDPGSLKRVVFCCFSNDSALHHEAALAGISTA
jgi:O-acetyl-ADP-ribose deacetylase (regulator of RNase III)